MLVIYRDDCSKRSFTELSASAAYKQAFGAIVGITDIC
jgi:hypothetical protein